MDIIEAARRLGYENFNDVGVCYGIACLGAQIGLEGGNDELDRFVRRIEIIQKWDYPESFAINIIAVQEKWKQKVEITKDEVILL